MTQASNATHRFQLTLRKPWPGWYPNPTVVVNGDAQPTLWGTRNWKVAGTDPVEVNVFLFNRAWKFGEAAITVEAGAVVSYRAPWLPFGPGKIRAA